jgi:hypothetical protein
LKELIRKPAELAERGERQHPCRIRHCVPTIARVTCLSQ